MRSIFNVEAALNPTAVALPPAKAEAGGSSQLRLTQQDRGRQGYTHATYASRREATLTHPLGIAIAASREGHRNSRTLRPLLLQYGIDLDAAFSVIASRNDGPFRQQAAVPCAIALDHSCVDVVVGRHRITLVQHPRRARAHAEAILATLEGQSPRLSRIGIGEAPGGTVDLRTAVLEAEAAMLRGFGINEREPLRLDQLLCALPTDSLREHAESLLEPLHRHDSERQTELLKTLHALVAEDFSTVRVAKRLFVHQNTVKYRVAQIGALTGLDLNRLGGRAQLWMALTLLEPSPVRPAA